MSYDLNNIIRLAPAIQTTSISLQGQLLEIVVVLKQITRSKYAGLEAVTIDPDLVTKKINITAQIYAEVELDGDSITITATDEPNSDPTT